MQGTSVFFVARGQSSKVFDPVEEPLDAIERAIEYRAEARFPAAMEHWRAKCFSSSACGVMFLFQATGTPVRR
jgi:hypothetical protein